MYYSDTSTDPQLFDPVAFTQALQDSNTPIPVFRGALKKGDEILHGRFESSRLVYEIIPARAWLVDQILREAWKLYDWPQPDSLALIAVGGYGRKELHPGSDIDLLILYENVLNSDTKTGIENFLIFLWDIGLEVGHSVRSLEECQEAAASDITVVTNLMESRLLIGPQYLFEAMQSLTGSDKIWPDRVFFEAKQHEQQRRHHRYYDTTYNLEPNIKEGPGGLRDIQTLAWVAKRHFGANTLHDLIRYGFLTEEEYRTLNECQEFLWRIRYVLHKLTGRHEDRLAFDYQCSLATLFGYEDEAEKLGVEKFMKQYYRTAREVSVLNEMLLQLFQEAIVYDGPTEIKPLSSRFQICNDFIEVTYSQVFEKYPFALLEIFLMMQYYPEIKGIRASTARLIRHYNFLIDRAFLRDNRARSLFIEIIRQPHGLTHAFRAMNRYGILPAYIPAFGKIVGQMQYDLFHVYTVDQHTLFIIRNLRRFAIAAHDHELPLCSEILQRLPKPELLYLAGLFHDIGKGRGGDHSQLGEHEALDFCLAHGLSDYDSRFVGWLVRNHLIMSTTAQRQDTSDPDVVNTFAQRIGDLLHLDYLYLLTVADIRATNPKLWNDWKSSLLADLYRKTRHALSKGLENPIDKQVRVRDIQAQAQRLLSVDNRIKAVPLWAGIDDDYFLRSSVDNIAREAQAILSKPGDQPLVIIREGIQGGTEFLIYTEYMESLFADTTHYLELQHVTIVDAYIITTSGKCTLLNYTVLEENGDNLQDAERAEALRAGLANSLRSSMDFSPINRRQPRQVKYFPVPTRVVFNVDFVNNHTVMEVVTTDRPGVLSRIAQALMKCNARVKSAKIATFGTRVEDVFFITDRDNQALRLPDQFDCLQEELARLLDEPKTDAVQVIRI